MNQSILFYSVTKYIYSIHEVATILHNRLGCVFHFITQTRVKPTIDLNNYKAENVRMLFLPSIQWVSERVTTAALAINTYKGK